MILSKALGAGCAAGLCLEGTESICCLFTALISHGKKIPEVCYLVGSFFFSFFSFSVM